MWAMAGLFAVVAAAGIAVLDRPVALWAATLGGGAPFWDDAVAIVDRVTLRDISNFLLGPILMIAAGVLLLLRSTRSLGWACLYVGTVQFASTVVADLARPQFGRMHPAEAMGVPGGVDSWLVGANSFPSGHVAFYAGLFFPLMLLVPRWAVAWAIPPAFIAAARIVSNDHYLGDIAASLALAALMSAAFAFILERADAAA
jgi:membrane-associated phospholipid phosphatase